jgi:hypothetical protein
MNQRGRYPKTPEHRAKLAEATRRQMAARRAAGTPAPNRGVKFSDAARQNMSAARRGNTNAQTHGMLGTRTHTSWRDMLMRVRQPSYPSYANYGGRGIRVCDRWLAFENFYADMGERPPGMTLDRLDSDGHYQPENCRWATPKEQAANRRSRKEVPLAGDA